jgi:hypothetical protein
MKGVWRTYALRFALAKNTSCFMKGVMYMHTISMEVPRTTDRLTIGVPVDEFEDCLWSFEIIFNEIEHLKTRLVTILDNNCGDREKGLNIRNQIANNDNMRLVEFNYEINKDDIKANITIKVFFSKKYRIVFVEW